MKTLIFLLSLLSISAAHANEKLFFSMIPTYAVTKDAVSAVSAAALKRKWTVNDFENNKLRIELDHRGYKAILDFTFTEDEIHYTDLTTYYSSSVDDDPYESEGKWEKSPAPARWIQNLKNDVNFHFNNSVYARTRSDSSTESVEKKLEDLKALYDKKLITEAEYQQKKKEIMSKF